MPKARFPVRISLSEDVKIERPNDEQKVVDNILQYELRQHPKVDWYVLWQWETSRDVKMFRSRKPVYESYRTHSISGFGCFFFGSTNLTIQVETKVVKAMERNTCSGSKS